MLVAKGYPVTYVERPGTHNGLAWRQTIADGLIAVVPAAEGTDLLSPNRRRVVAALVAFALGLCVTSAREAPRATRVLFIGNSYTYFNNLPAVFARVAEATGAGPVEVGMVAPGGTRLVDHWTRGEARATFGASRWDVVVLQDQSTLGVGPTWTAGRVCRPTRRSRPLPTSGCGWSSSRAPVRCST